MGYGKERHSILCLQGANIIVSLKMLVLGRLSKRKEVLNLGSKMKVLYPNLLPTIGIPFLQD